MTMKVSRREFLTTGTGLIVFVSSANAQDRGRGAIGDGGRGQGIGRGPGSGLSHEMNAYLRINSDGRVTCFVGKVELGQNEMGAMAACLAEELDVAFDSVDVIMSDTDLCPWDFQTGGSTGIMEYSPLVRAAGAEARTVLLRMASEQLEAPVERLQVKDGVITDPVQNKSLSYAKMIQGKRIERHIENVPLKPVSSFKVIGKPLPRKDGLLKVTGKAKYTADFTAPGMMYARILRPPAHDAVFKSVDTSAAEKIGARIVRDKELIAVLHERWDLADKALKLLKAEFDRPAPTVDDKTIFDHLLKNAPQPKLLAEKGSLSEGEGLASVIEDATYLNSYVNHAPIEPHAALAVFEGEKLTVWASTQAPFPLKDAIAKELGMQPQNVRVIAPFIGGAFGGKAMTTPVSSRQAIEAAQLAKAAGCPVQVMFDREEEFFLDPVRPAAVIKIRAGIDRSGKIVVWNYLVVAAGERDAVTLYDIPHQRTTMAGSWAGFPEGFHPFRIGPWRGPSANSNGFARESHIDILAHKAGMDPWEFRMHNLTDERMRRVLEAAAKLFGYKPARTPSGRGIGIACAAYRGESRMATIAEVDVDKKTGHVQLKRVARAMDHGMTVNPEGVRAQMEGGIMMSLGYALTEEVRFRGGEKLDRDFDTYQIAKFSWAPAKIDTVVIDNMNMAPTGAGEEPTTTTGAFMANAIFDATGARLFQLPMTPTRVLEALKMV
jgi:nicotinate dehydrogenase subunit B